jgi:acyl carrier protein
MEQREQIRQFLADVLRRKGDPAPFTDSDSLILGGRLESIDAVEIVMFLENRFGVDFSTIGFDQTLIDSVDCIVELIQPRASAAAQ